MSSTFKLDTNIAELPWNVTQRLSQYLNINNEWHKLIDDTISLGIYSYRMEQIDSFGRQSNPSESLLRDLGNRGVTVKDLLLRLHSLSRLHHGSSLDRPQLVLRRKFAAVRWTRSEQIIVTIINSGIDLQFECKADGFPFPQFQWLIAEREIDGANDSLLIVSRCQCCLRNKQYQCRVSNEVDANEEWSSNYRCIGKQFQSEIISKPVDITSYYESLNSVCDRCKQNEYDRICELAMLPAKDNDELSASAVGESNIINDDLVATDKVALIISNSEYWYLPRLLTPPCDAETLAELLLEIGFKTVTLADLTLNEMKSVIQEYRRLLGAGVYAVFYFVGHGFEANGQCYLVPVDSPGVNYRPKDCLSDNWVLKVMQDYSPALNLILLDVCRKYLPANMIEFVAEAARYDLKVNRNTVVGYATCGVGAYEVRGDTNGIFMKYLKNHLKLAKPVTDIIKYVLRDLENDPRAADVQFPELRTNLSRDRSLADPLIYTGHTISYVHHTNEWQNMHELPKPTSVTFDEHCLRVTVWFDFCGQFTNMVYVFSSVSDICADDDADNDDRPSQLALAHLAYVRFESDLETVHTKICSDHEEGVSVRTLLKNLQKSKGPLICTVELHNKETNEIVATAADITLGHVLITRLNLHLGDVA